MTRPFRGNAEREPTVGWVRFAIEQPPNRRLRVVVYARYSTEDQNPHSIDAQVAYCKRFLHTMGITDYELAVLQDVEMSGELRRRPGIDDVWTGIEADRWDLILVEDASRIYRHDSWAVDLVFLAVDHRMRVICINDCVDTADDQRLWIPRLKDATRAHAVSNQYTSDRIKRALEHQWQEGAAVSALRPGYRRYPTVAATERESAKGPYFDEVDETWTSVIVSAFEQIAMGDPPWQVAAYLTEKKLPKAPNAKLSAWTEKTVNSLIRETLYRGWDVYRTTVVKKELATGKKRPELSDPSQRLTRPMSHLQIVSDELWHEANAAIDARRTTENFRSGPDHPLFGVPRDRRSLLTTLAKCGTCGAPLHKGGRNGNAYVCSAAVTRKCWNRATADQALIEDGVKQAVRKVMKNADAVVDAFTARLQSLIGEREPVRRQLEDLRAELADTQNCVDRLVKSIANSDNPTQSIVTAIAEYEDRMRCIGSQVEKLQRFERGEMIPTRKEIGDRLRQVMADLDADDRTAGVALRKIVRRIDAIPFQQFNTTKVVIRAKVVIDLMGLLAVEFRAVLSELHGDGIQQDSTPTIVMIDTFRPSSSPACGLKAEALAREQDLTIMQVAQQLGLSKRPAHLAIVYGRAMRQAGLTDPFIELTQAPEKAAHWGPHKGSRRRRRHLSGAADSGLRPPLPEA